MPPNSYTCQFYGPSPRFCDTTWRGAVLGRLRILHCATRHTVEAVTDPHFLPYIDFGQFALVDESSLLEERKRMAERKRMVTI